MTTLPDNTRNPSGAPRRSQSTGLLTRHFPIIYSREIKRLGFGANSEGLYRHNISIHSIIGASISYTPPSNAGSLSLGGAFFSGDTIEISRTNNTIQRFGASLTAGVILQLYNKKNRPTWNLTLYYSQGLRRLVNFEIDYTLNGETFATTLISRGTVAGIHLSYPIRLKKWD
ncbi:hypothetical protein RCC89_17785 [Cytophagaceae bacterium ABcell3]|nr:hypothetical protein RCC89_17785 [Cytophagaceae bacterium ABcell3]